MNPVYLKVTAVGSNKADRGAVCGLIVIKEHLNGRETG